MSFILVPGTAVSIASVYGDSKAMSAISNAAEAVATLEASHGVVENDIIEITSAWPKADKRVLRADSVATNDVTLEDFDTQNTNQYPAGTGAGSVREISTWLALSQLAQDISAAGGEQQFTNLALLNQDDLIALPTTRSPVTLTIPVYYDPALAWLATVRAARDNKSPVAVKMSFPSGAVLYGNAYWSMNDVPSVRDGVLATTVQLTFAAQPAVYAG
jgi:hypothetical protein